MATDPENKPGRDDALEQVIKVAKPDDAIPLSELDGVSGGGHGHALPHGGSA